jgi:hypothetical protein
MADTFSELLDTIDNLNRLGIPYVISGMGLPRSIRIRAMSPGRLWEIDVLEDGPVEVQVYEALDIEGVEALQRLYDLFEE